MEQKLSKNFWVSLGLILLVGLSLRLIHLESDIPWDFSWSQGVLTDGPWYVDKVVSKIQNLPHNLPQKSFNRPFFTYFSYIIFSLFGLGLFQLNLISVIPGILCVFFLGHLVARIKGEKTGIIAAILLAFNYFYFTYNRTPMIYTMLTFYI